MPRILYIIVCLFPLFLLRAQEDMTGMMHRFETYAGSNPVEKLYLHLDKPYYTAGEYIYFRAYLTDIHLNQEAVASHIIYVELSDERKELILRTLLYSEGTEYAGQFLLPDTLPAASYHLRAYTNWMRNAGEEYFYHRDIYIGHPTEKKATPSMPFDYEASFFPEGGRLLSGLENKVAFKALTNNGFGTDITGVLTDGDGNEVCRFNSLHLGMGSFTFMPEKGGVYTVTTESHGQTNTYTLPPAVEGMALSVSQTTDSIRLVIKSTNPSAIPVRILAQARHTICYALTGSCKQEEEVVWIPKDRFPTGIAQFILFKDSLPVNERLAFIDRKDDLRISIVPDKPAYGDREKVKLTVRVEDRDGNPVEGSFSLSVTDDKVVAPSIGEENIKGALLLDADLKGCIEQPGWYFSGDGLQRTEALDNLLCTQGWTRYEWQDMFEPEKACRYPAEKEFQVSGRVTNLIGKPVRNGEVILFTNNNLPGIAKTDQDGRFRFYGFDCPDTTILVLQARTKNNRATFIGLELDKPENHHTRTNMFPLPETYNRYNESQMTSYTKQAILQMNNEENIWMIHLSPVTVKAKRIRDRESIGIASYHFSGKYLNKKYPITNILRSLPRPNRGITSLYAAPIVIYEVDGMRMHVGDFIMFYSSFRADMFESVEVLRAEDAVARFGILGSSGAYVFKTKQNLGNDEIPDASIQVYHPDGYCIRKEFYVSAYDKLDVKQNLNSDLRTTIYWNSFIRTNQEGIASVEFYTADQTGSYTYILEGIGNNTILFKNADTEKHIE